MDSSITHLDSPDRYSSVYGQINWLINSTNKTKAGFSYILNLYSGQSSWDIIASLKFPKRPTTGYGLIDVSSVLKPYIDHEKDLIPNAGGFLRADHYYKRYNMQWGEQSDYFTFSDSLFYPGNYVLFSSYTGDRHDFLVGEQIVIVQTPPVTYPQFDGIHTVIATPDEFSVVVDVQFSSGPVTPGKAFRNDTSPIVFTGITSGVSVCVGYSFPRHEMTTFNSDDYRPMPGQSTQAQLITNVPEDFRIRMDSQAWIPQHNSGYADILRVITQQEDGTTVGVYEITNAHNSIQNECEFCYAPVGPVSLINSSYSTLFGPSTIFDGDVHQYNVAFLSASSTNAMTELRTFVIDTRCQPFVNYKLIFCDKRGAWIPYDFAYKSTETHTIKKSTYYKAGYGEVVGTSMVYRDQRRGYDPYVTEHLKSITVRSDWMTQAELDYLFDGYSTPRAFWCKSATQFLPIVIDDYEEIERMQTDQEEDLIRMEVKFSLAYKENAIQ